MADVLQSSLAPRVWKSMVTVLATERAIHWRDGRTKNNFTMKFGTNFTVRWKLLKYHYEEPVVNVCFIEPERKKKKLALERGNWP